MIDEIVLASLFERLWWRWVWVIQEAVFARSAVIICGGDTLEISWTDLRSAFNLISSAVSELYKVTFSRGWIMIIISFLAGMLQPVLSSA